MTSLPDITTVIQVGTSNPWLMLPVAVLLGALHALEPGHSKALMAGFIVAVRGTVAQAWILGASAAVGHTMIVWLLALIGLSIGDKLIAERAEPWLLLLSGLLIMGMALRMLWPFLRPHGHGHAHHHGDHDHHDHNHAVVHNGHTHVSASDIAKAYQGRTVSAGEVAWFGFTGGLLPCPAAIAVLLVCLQLKAFSLGIAMVAAFSVGLAATLIAVGVIAAWGTRQASAKWRGFDRWSTRLPVLSGLLVLLIGLVFAWRGLVATSS